MKRACPLCSSPVIGRTNKIYCSTPCKNAAWENKKREQRLNDEALQRRKALRWLNLIPRRGERFRLATTEDLGFDRHVRRLWKKMKLLDVAITHAAARRDWLRAEELDDERWEAQQQRSGMIRKWWAEKVKEEYDTAA